MLPTGEPSKVDGRRLLTCLGCGQAVQPIRSPALFVIVFVACVGLSLFLIVDGGFKAARGEWWGWGRLAGCLVWLVGAARVVSLVCQPTARRLPTEPLAGSVVRLERLTFDGAAGPQGEPGRCAVTAFVQSVLTLAAETLPAGSVRSVEVTVRCSAVANGVTINYGELVDPKPLTRFLRAVAALPPVPANGLVLCVWLRVEG